MTYLAEALLPQLLHVIAQFFIFYFFEQKLVPTPLAVRCQSACNRALVPGQYFPRKMWLLGIPPHLPQPERTAALCQGSGGKQRQDKVTVRWWGWGWWRCSRRTPFFFFFKNVSTDDNHGSLASPCFLRTLIAWVESEKICSADNNKSKSSFQVLYYTNTFCLFRAFFLKK